MRSLNYPKYLKALLKIERNIVYCITEIFRFLLIKIYDMLLIIYTH